MHFESLWFRRIFCALLFLQSAFGLLIAMAFLRQFHHLPPKGESLLPQPWGSLVSNADTLVHFALMPLWIFLIVFLLRFEIVLRQASRKLSPDN